MALTNLITRYLKSEAIVNDHLNKDYPLSAVFYQQSILLQTFNFLSLTFGDPNLDACYWITIIYSAALFRRGYLNFYIMLYHNKPTTEVALQGVKTCAYFVGAGTLFHTAQCTYILPPNKLSNAYNINAPLGRGYGADTNSQLIAADIIHGWHGKDFDVKSITDENTMICSKKLAIEYKRVRDESFKQFGEYIFPSYTSLIPSVTDLFKKKK